MALGEKEKKQLFGFLAALGLGAIAGFWFYWPHPASVKQITDLQVKITKDSLQVDSAKQDLARGSVEALRQRVKDYEGAVRLMRRLVPSAGEVPNLIDDVSSRAKHRGITVAQFSPLAVEEGNPFQTHRYHFGVVGRFDQVGEFLADVGSLGRIMVPYDVTLGPATQQAQKVAGDSSGALLQVEFNLRAYVKPPGAGDSTQAGGAQ